MNQELSITQIELYKLLLDETVAGAVLAITNGDEINAFIPRSNIY